MEVCAAGGVPRTRGWRAHQTPAEVGSRFGRPYRPPLRENRERVCRGGFYIRPRAPVCRMHQRRPHPVGARMARPSPVPATTGARDISNLVSGGYKIRPYGVDGGVRGRRSASDPGGAGPSNPGGSREPVRAAIQAAPTAWMEVCAAGGVPQTRGVAGPSNPGGSREPVRAASIL